MNYLLILGHVVNSGAAYGLSICIIYVQFARTLTGPTGQSNLPVINKLVPYQSFFIRTELAGVGQEYSQD